MTRDWRLDKALTWSTQFETVRRAVGRGSGLLGREPEPLVEARRRRVIGVQNKPAEARPCPLDQRLRERPTDAEPSGLGIDVHAAGRVRASLTAV